jgi:hypothetical protein
MFLDQYADVQSGYDPQKVKHHIEILHILIAYLLPYIKFVGLF